MLVAIGYTAIPVAAAAVVVGLSLSASLGTNAGPTRSIGIPVALSLLTVVGAAAGLLARSAPPRRTSWPEFWPSGRSPSCTS